MMKVLSLLVSDVICDEVGAVQKSEEQDVGTIMHDKRKSEGKRNEQVVKKCMKDVKLLNLNHVQDHKTFQGDFSNFVLFTCDVCSGQGCQM